MPLVKRTLEKILGEERYEKWKRKAYGFVVEAWAMNSFSYALCAPMELGIAGMDFMEHIKTRGVGVITNTIIARPYGIARDWFLKKIGITKKSHWLKKYAADTLACTVLFPVYEINTYLSGADSTEVITAFIPIALAGGATGGLYGMYLDWTRRKCGVPVGYETEKK